MDEQTKTILSYAIVHIAGWLLCMAFMMLTYSLLYLVRFYW